MENDSASAASLLSFKLVLKQVDDDARWPTPLHLEIFIASSSSATLNDSKSIRSELCRTETSAPQLICTNQHIRIFEISYYVACSYDHINWESDVLEVEVKQQLPPSSTASGMFHRQQGEPQSILRASLCVTARGLFGSPTADDGGILQLPLTLHGLITGFESWNVEITKTSVSSPAAPIGTLSGQVPLSSRIRQLWHVLRAVNHSSAASLLSPAMTSHGRSNGRTSCTDENAHAVLKSRLIFDYTTRLLRNIECRYFALTSSAYAQQHAGLLAKRISATATMHDASSSFFRKSKQQHPLQSRSFTPTSVALGETVSGMTHVSVQDVLIESPTCCDIACRYLRIMIADCHALYDIVAHDDGLLLVVPELAALADAVRRVREQLHTQQSFLVENVDRDLHFKPSSSKADPLLACLPTNFHLHYTNGFIRQLLNKSAPENDAADKLYQMRLVTVGAFAAHAAKFNHGGMLRFAADRPHTASWLDTTCAAVIRRISRAKHDIDKQLSAVAAEALANTEPAHALLTCVSVEDDKIASPSKSHRFCIVESPISAFEALKHFVVMQYQQLLTPEAVALRNTIDESDLLGHLWHLKSVKTSKIPSTEAKSAELHNFSLCIDPLDWDENLCIFLNKSAALHGLTVVSPSTTKSSLTTENARVLADTARMAAHKLLDSLAVAFALFCSGFSRQQTSATNILSTAQFACDLSMRYAAVMCQAYSSLASALVTEILALITLQIANNNSNSDIVEWLGTAHGCGLLVCFESLLSCYGAERGMLEDFAYACDRLAHLQCQFMFIVDDDGNDDADAEEDIVENFSRADSGGFRAHLRRDKVSGHLILSIKIPKALLSISQFPEKTENSEDDLFSKFSVYYQAAKNSFSSNHTETINCDKISGSFTIPVRLCPVLFNVGINEKATLAETLGNNELENMLNRKGAPKFSAYAKRRRDFADEVNRISHATKQDKRLNALTRLVGELEDECKRAVGKYRKIRILKLAAQACRAARGIRFTSCKSAKDRTAMSVTLEQGTWLHEELHAFGGDSEDESEKTMLMQLVTVLRTDGVRLRNVMKNIGAPKYAFSQLQLLTFPEQYRPPVSVCSKSVQT